MRKGTLIRSFAWGAVAAGVAAPLVRRRLRVPPVLTMATAAAAPVGLAVALPKSRARDVGICALQMWAYIAAYEIPNDVPGALAERVHIDYPAEIDKLIGLGRAPTHRFQSLFAHPGEIQDYEKVLVWTHWAWFTVPHGTALYVLMRRREMFPKAAFMTYAVFDIGALVYWLAPTAPPWYAAEQGRFDDGHTPRIRRMMIEYGAQFWKDHWGPLYSSLAGNPFAAMPSLHFATSVMAAKILRRTGKVAGAIGWGYTGTLGVALVYLGEHYVIDLIAGAALAEGVWRVSGPLAPVGQSLGAAVNGLQRRAAANG
ncbi:MAG: phosphatase PAP2 family protein [Solirubrobacterales bacterium]|nr:phosphatase PAP2 family protein [Solirubrobacterales bacterium]